jgi:two-component system response regulator RstA
VIASGKRSDQGADEEKRHVPKVLLVEDDRDLSDLMVEALGREGYDVEPVLDGGLAVERVRAVEPDLVVLDVMLPNVDGFTVCRRAREFYAGPILFLTAREDDADQVLGLELGGDDYLIKPVRPRVLVARLKALLRRVDVAPDSAEIHAGPLVVNPRKRQVSLDGQPVKLTTAEFELLLFLAGNRGRVVARETLYRELRGVEYDGIDRSIDLRVSRVRGRLRAVAPDLDLIKTVHGQGYLLAEP